MKASAPATTTLFGLPKLPPRYASIVTPLVRKATAALVRAN
jgi:hypothetical protein